MSHPYLPTRLYESPYTYHYVVSTLHSYIFSIHFFYFLYIVALSTVLLTRFGPCKDELRQDCMQRLLVQSLFFNVSAVNDDGDCLLLACQRTKWPCVDCLCPVKAGNGRLATGLGTERNEEHDEMLFCIRFRCVL